MDNQIPHPVKKERMAALMEVVQRRAQERAQRFVGRTDRGPGRRSESQRSDPDPGRSRHNKAVNFEGTAEPGQLVEVEIESATSKTLTGTERLLSGIGA